MNLFFLQHDLARGGGGRAVRGYAVALARRGHEVELRTDFAPDLMEARSLWPETLSLHWRYRERRFKGGTRLFAWCEKRAQRGRLARRLRRRGLHAVLGYQANPDESLALARRIGAPLVLFGFETEAMLWRQRGQEFGATAALPRFRDAYARYQEAMRHAVLVIAISEEGARSFREDEHCRRVVCVEPGIDPLFETITKGARREGAIVFVGRLQREKHIDVAIRALTALPESVTLTIVGEGPQRPELEALVWQLKLGARVRLTGYVSVADKWAAIASAAALVMPSVQEGFGIPPGEALLCGTPVIAADHAVLRGVYGDHLCYVPPRDPDALAQALAALLARPDTALAQAQDGKRFVQTRYTWAQAGDKLEQALAETLASSGLTQN